VSDDALVFAPDLDGAETRLGGTLVKLTDRLSDDRVEFGD
jgi:hypothetical protein